MAGERPEVAVGAVIVDDDHLLLIRRGHGPAAGKWSVPGGRVERGETLAEAVVREVREETGLACTPGDVLDVGSTHFEGTAPSGRREDFHALQVVFAAEVSAGEPRVLEVDGTTDEAAWVPLTDIDSGDRQVRPVVRSALARRLPS